jgi:hypothetical protein
MNEKEFANLHREMDEVIAGRRGWVSLTKSRAKLIGIDHLVLVETARTRGLKVAQNGRHGWTGSRQP